jgi:signal transduction histidine kinase/DNA-binding response OmpR family regulator
MNKLLQTTAIWAGATVVAVVGAILWKYDAGPVHQAILAGVLAALAFAALYRSLAPLVAGAEAAAAAQAQQAAALQKRLTALESHMQYQIGAHIKTAETEKKQANEANAAKTHFLVHFSHEVRTPLTGLISSVDLLARSPLTEQQRRLVGTMDRSAHMLLDIVANAVDLSLAEGGKLKLERQPFDLNECVEGAAEAFLAEARNKELDLSVFVSNDLPSAVVGDQGRVRQVLMNLIGNAVKFTSSGSIDVSAMQSARQDGIAKVRFVVRDTGSGIAPELQKVLFLPVEKRDPAQTGGLGGNGLGLSIVHQLVTLMGGSIRLDSKPGQGTVVEVELPLEVAEAATEGDVFGPDAYAGLRMLVIGTREQDRQVAGSYLATAGAQVDAAASAWEGLDLIRQAVEAGNPFLLVVADAELPCEWNGDFATGFRKEVPETQTGLVVIISDESELDHRQAEAKGRWEHVTKPLRRRELFEAIDRQLALIAVPEDGTEPSADREEQPAPVLTVPARVQKQEQRPIRAHVLVAEDNLINQEVMREYLAEFGCSFKIVNNGEEAVRAFERTAYDIVLMDCQMPIMDGLSATSEIRMLEQKHGLKRTPIVAVSAHAFERERVRCLGAQMDDFLSKPYTESELREIMLKALDNARRARAA